MIKRGADVNARDRNQGTPLHIFASTGALAFARLLLMCNVTADAKDWAGYTPLHEAVLASDRAMVQLLTEVGGVSSNQNRSESG